MSRAMARASIGAALALATLLASCSPAPATSSQPDGGQSTPSAPKLIVAAVRQEPTVLAREVTGGEPGTQAALQLVGAGLTIFNQENALIGQLAEASPTVENGLWKVLPDGRMEMTWKIRPNAEWHDGTPFTSADMAFTTRLSGVIGGFDDPGLRLFDRLETPDARTVVALWKQSFIGADQLFSPQLLTPLPRHRLEKAFVEDPSTFMQLPYWTQEYIGTGPFRLREWVRGTYLVVEANERYVLGRPKIDRIEVQFISNLETMAASLLSGTVDLSLGGTFPIHQALDLQGRSRDLTVLSSPIGALRRAAPQLETPSPAIISNLEFRRALLHAINRQEMIDTLEAGQSAVPVSFLSPGQAQYRDVEAPLPRYDYDPRRATAMISALGYTPGPAGIFLGPDGQQLEVELRFHSGQGDDDLMVLAVADYWRRAGVATDVFPVPFQLRQNVEYRSQRPAFHFSGGTHNVAGLKTFHSSDIPRPETNWEGQNHARYASAEYDALYERFISTIPQAERMQALGQVLMNLAVNLPVLPIYYLMDPTVYNNRLLNVGSRQLLASQAWNSHEWDVR